MFSSVDIFIIPTGPHGVEIFSSSSCLPYPPGQQVTTWDLHVLEFLFACARVCVCSWRESGHMIGSRDDILSCGVNVINTHIYKGYKMSSTTHYFHVHVHILVTFVTRGRWYRLGETTYGKWHIVYFIGFVYRFLSIRGLFYNTHITLRDTHTIFRI